MGRKLTVDDINSRIPETSRLRCKELAEKDKRGQYRAVFTCECGNEVRAIPGDVFRGHTTSCGCFMREQGSNANKYSKEQIQELLPANTKLSPIKDTNIKKGNRRIWQFQCVCGNIVEIPISDAINGHTRSCGCLHIESAIEKLTEHGHKNRFIQKHRERLALPTITKEQFGYRSLKNRKYGKDKDCHCEFCGKHSKTTDHHITMVSAFANRFLTKISRNWYEFSDNVINHKRNLISLCPECHALVHKDGYHTVDKEMSKIFKAIKRFTF